MNQERRRSAGLRPRILFLFALISLAGGCGDGEFSLFGGKKEPPPEPAPAPADRRDPLLIDTIGGRTLTSDAEPMLVRGYGVVIGLGDDGGTDCPTAVREYLIDYLAREAAAEAPISRFYSSPNSLLDSPDAAVVQISGVIPAGAPAGAMFDVQVEAMGTQTRSIDGGLLLESELKIFEPSMTGAGIIASRTYAKARGVVLTNPFSQGSDGDGEARRGVVLGGSRSLVDRTVRLVLDEPSYSTARRIERRINERFGQNPSAANAMSQSYVTLKTPVAYRTRPGRFIDLAAHLYLEASPGFTERKLRELADEIAKAAGPDRRNHVSLIWEGIGRAALPQIQPLYGHSDPAVAFFSARAGTRLGDASAATVLANLASADDKGYRVSAIRELGASDMGHMAGRLLTLLDSTDQEVRVAAYQALLGLGHPSVRSTRFPNPMDPSVTNLIVDVVPSAGPPLIFVTRTGSPRIAIFGRDVPVELPVFYSHPREFVTVNAAAGDPEITVFCRTRKRRVLSDMLKAAPRVDDLIRRLAAPPLKDTRGDVQGLGLSYGLVLQTLNALVKTGSIDARLAIEHATLEDLFGPTPLDGDRPETDADTLGDRTRPTAPASSSSEERPE